jgi:UDP-N-acetylmuramyl pentapeptide phosphotransferase/UDP-N-acetylglucosamine-1-phosphate transferase
VFEIGGGKTQALLVTALVIGPAIATYAFIQLLKPLLRRYALARPNARSSHSQPTPQGAGIAIIVVTGALFSTVYPDFDAFALAPVLVAGIVLAVVGAIDDIRTLEAIPRLAVQSLAVLIVVVTMPPVAQILTSIPLWFERALLFFALLWFVNLVNFMDGIDCMSVAEIVPIAAALALSASWARSRRTQP